MTTPMRVAAFVTGLLALFGVAVGVGSLAGPAAATGPATPGSTAGPGGHGPDDGGGAHGGEDHGGEDHSGEAPAAGTGLPGGLMVTQDGYTLDLAQRQLPARADAPLTFRVLGPDGRPVTRYTTEHGQDLHLIAVRRDLTHFQHVHPRRAADGTWSTTLDLSDPGTYRVFADFTPAGADGLTLGSDVAVAGRATPQPLPSPGRTAEVDGYTVTLDGTLEPGQESELTLSVSKDGQPVTDLQPYLEAYGHLVALRDRDLAYLHVHPLGSPGDGRTAPGPGITFAATVPSAGAYRLFLDFRHDDVVRTAEFTATAGAGG